VLAACALGVTAGWNVSNIGAAAPTLAKAYGVALPTVGLFAAALFASQLLVQVPAGRLVDRFGCRRLGWWCLGGFIVANAAACIAPHPALALASRAAMGPAMGIGFVGGSAYIQAAGGSSFAQGLFGGISMGTGGAAIAIVPSLVSVFDWRAPYIGAIGVAVLVVPLFAVGPAHVRVAAVRDVLVRRIAMDPVIWRLSALQAATFGLSTVIGNWIAALAERTTTITPQVAGLAGGLTLLGGVVSRPGGGWLGGRFPQHAHTMVAGSLLLGALATAMLVTGPPLPVFVVSSLLLGVAAGVPYGPIMHRAAQAYAEAPASALAAMNTGAVLVVVAGVPAVGATFALPGDGRLGFAVVAILWVAAIAATSVLAPATARGSILPGQPAQVSEPRRYDLSSATKGTGVDE
jgi:MFS family permease